MLSPPETIVLPPLSLVAALLVSGTVTRANPLRRPTKANAAESLVTFILHLLLWYITNLKGDRSHCLPPTQGTTAAPSPVMAVAAPEPQPQTGERYTCNAHVHPTQT